jgi:neurofibromin 1
VKELVGHEMSPALYPILFDQIKIIVEKFFDQGGQVIVIDTNTQFIEHIIFIMKNVLEAGTSNNSNSSNSSSSSKSGDQQQHHHTENLGQTSIELMMLAIVRYVRHLDTTVHALHIKTRLCQLVEAMMKRRDDLAFRSV